MIDEVMTGRLLDFKVQIAWQPESPNVTYGRSRWLPDGKALAYLGLDDRGHARIFVQDVVPGRDTTDTRRRLPGTPDNAQIESFAIAPDGRQIAISTQQQVASLNLADGLSKLR